LMRRLTFRVTLASIPSTWESLLPLVSAGRLRPEDVFTHHMGLSEAAEAYRIFDGHEDGVLKVLLDPSVDARHRVVLLVVRGNGRVHAPSSVTLRARLGATRGGSPGIFG
jgi:hypothetical protein